MPRGLSSPAIDFAEVHNFLFDLDGTLVDSSPCHERAFRAALRSGFPDLADRFDYRRVMGMATEDALRAYGIDETDGALRRLAAAKRRGYRDMVAGGLVALYPGARRLLDDLKGRGRRLFLVTGASAESADQVLRQCRIREYFDDVVTAADVARGKPAPDLFQLVVARHNLARPSCLTVEDALAGILASRAAGIAAVAVHNPGLEDEAACSFETLDDLLAAIQHSHRENGR
jgi:HAD superfamily hydrolase (TIGR01509 family)